MNTEAHERFLSVVTALAAVRPDEADVRAYERLKREYLAACPEASQQQYEAAIAAIARATGV